MPPYQLTFGIASANTGDLAAAAGALERSASTDDLPAAWLDLAAVRHAQGDDAGARTALASALRVGDQQAVVNLGAGTLFLALGDTTRATTSFALAVSQSPTLAGDPWWQAAPDRAAIWPGVLDRALGDAGPDGGFAIALAAGRLDQAARFADQLSSSAGDDLAQLVLRAWTGDEAARSSISARASTHPFDTAALGWAVRLAARAGDRDQAARFSTWAAGVDPLAGANGLVVRVVTGEAGLGNSLAGSSSLFYGHYEYRRPTPWTQLVASLPQLAYQ